MSVPTWDEYFMSMCYLASTRSKDPDTRVGAVIVGANKQIISIGYNSYPRNCRDEELPKTRPEKYQYIEHAERNAIYNACLNGVSCAGGMMYVPFIPCCDCARAVIQCGILEVIYDTDYTSKCDESSATRTLFEHAKIRLRKFEGTLLFDQNRKK